MVFAVPALPTRAAGLKLTAAIYAADITTPINNLTNRPIFKGYQSAAQSISNATVTAITMDTEAVDSENGHSTSSNTSRYVAPVAGWYLVIAQVSYATNATGNRLVEIHVNGAAAANLAQTAILSTTASNNPATSAVSLVNLAAGDYVEAYTYQTSGGALNTVPGQSGMQVIWTRA